VNTYTEEGRAAVGEGYESAAAIYLRNYLSSRCVASVHARPPPLLVSSMAKGSKS
jgi:hypothetical protein